MAEGWRRKNTILALAWPEGSPYAGLVVRARTASLGQLFDISDMAEGADRITAVNYEKIRSLYAMFAERLVSWNVLDEKTGEPVPATAEQLHKEEHPLVMAIIYAWMDAIQGVITPAGPLDSDGSSDQAPPDLGLSMEPITGEQ